MICQELLAKNISNAYLSHTHPKILTISTMQIANMYFLVASRSRRLYILYSSSFFFLSQEVFLMSKFCNFFGFQLVPTRPNLAQLSPTCPNLPQLAPFYTTVFPSLKPEGLIYFYFGNSDIISEQGSISVVIIS